MAQNQQDTDPLLREVMRQDNIPQQMSDDEWAATLGQTYFLVRDDDIQAQLRADPDLKVLMPVLSALVRTGNLSKRAVALAKVQWRLACRIQLMLKKPPNLVSMSKFLAWIIHGNAALDDSLGGWRGRLVTERIKTYKIESANKKRSRFRLFGR